MTDDEYDRWRCETCGHQEAVPSLARECEAKHKLELAELQAVS